MALNTDELSDCVNLIIAMSIRHSLFTFIISITDSISLHLGPIINPCHIRQPLEIIERKQERENTTYLFIIFSL